MVKHRKILKLINNANDYQLIIRCVSKPNFISQKMFNINFVAIHQIKSVFSVLELSKLLMYKFHYEYLKNKFDPKLLFTDIGSLIYEIKGENVMKCLIQINICLILVIIQ